MPISLRLKEAEEAYIRNFAKLKGVTVSDLVRQTVLERIEDEYDLQAYEEAMAEFEKDPVTISHEDLMKKYAEDD